MSEGLAFKTFVSETEIEEKRKQRQEEWDKVRTADQPEECPEEEYETRSLFDRLQEQKDRKQAEFDEQHQFKNMVRGLDDDETKFLDEVAVRQMELEDQKRKEEREIMREVEEYKDRVLSVEEPTSSSKTTEQERKKLVDSGTSKRKSQAALLAGAVKRKKSDTADESDAKKPKVTTDSTSTSSSTTTNSTPQVSSSSESTNTNPSIKNGTVHQQNLEEQKSDKTRVVAVLPGLGHYANSDDSDTSESSDSELDLMGPLVRMVMKKKRVHPH